jgi:lysozyme family protein
MYRLLILVALIFFVWTDSNEHTLGELSNEEIMTAYEMCAAQTLDIEKGFVDNPNDAGGATNFGVSLRFLKRLVDIDKDGYVDGDIDRDGDVDVDDIKKLTLPDVYRIMKTYFWDELPITADESVPIKIRWKMFDIAINCSPIRAIKLLQQALGVDADGVWGIMSWKALKTTPEERILCALSQRLMKYYSQCVANKPTNLPFLVGWTDRAFTQFKAQS